MVYFGRRAGPDAFSGYSFSGYWGHAHYPRLDMVNDTRPQDECEWCDGLHDGSFGSGRFCNKSCAAKYSRSLETLG